MSAPRIVGDVGGTHARFATVAADGSLSSTVELASAQLGDLESALRLASLRLGAGDPVGGEVAVAVAAPVVGDDVALTNVGWSFSVERTRRGLGLARLLLRNDLEAAALALPRLGDDEIELWWVGEGDARAPKVVLSVGTGLGVGILVPAGEGWAAVASEGGHRDLAASEAREWSVVERLTARYGRASAERALSGPGLVALYETVCELDGRAAEDLAAPEVTARAIAGGDPACDEACRLFAGFLGAVAGDLVLTLGALGGVYFGGGALAGLAPVLDRERLLSRMAAKGRFAGYVRRAPVRRLTTSNLALIGAAQVLVG